jgi:hypothetical protein
MFVICLIILVLNAFCLGFCIGNNTEYGSKNKALKHSTGSSELFKEYENFLNYDGTKQS